jgi:DNA (cytosine-5)-methyltransferase 1
MTHGSLFSGIGGFDLAARWCGWTNVFQCEIDPFCQRVLRYHFPDTELYEDIKTTDFTKYRGSIDVLSGGFPCQPFSISGRRRGTDDDRFLWPEMLRVIREVRPTWVAAENVYGLLTQQQGVVFERVCTDLEDAGYEVPPVIIPACAVGALHRRDRIWFVAHRTDTRAESLQKWENGVYKSETITHANSDAARRYGHEKTRGKNGKTENEGDVPAVGYAIDISNKGVTTNASSAGKQRFKIRQGERQSMRNNNVAIPKLSTDPAGRRRIQDNESKQAEQSEQNIPNWRDFPTQSPVCWRDDGLSHGLAGITFPKWRGESIKAFGNAIVPQVAYELFKIIDKL